MADQTTYSEKMTAVQDARTLLELIAETSEPAGPIPDAVTKAQLALSNLQAVLAGQVPLAPPPAPAPAEPVPPPDNTIL